MTACGAGQGNEGAQEMTNPLDMVRVAAGPPRAGTTLAFLLPSLASAPSIRVTSTWVSTDWAPDNPAEELVTFGDTNGSGTYWYGETDAPVGSVGEHVALTEGIDGVVSQENALWRIDWRYGARSSWVLGFASRSDAVRFAGVFARAELALGLRTGTVVRSSSNLVRV